jgi:hypothetical protein
MLIIEDPGAGSRGGCPEGASQTQGKENGIGISGGRWIRSDLYRRHFVGYSPQSQWSPLIPDSV